MQKNENLFITNFKLLQSDQNYDQDHKIMKIVRAKASICWLQQWKDHNNKQD